MTDKQKELAESCINLVYEIAKKYMEFDSHEDILQEGFYVLCLAAERFDPEKGYKFSTYAYSTVSNYIKNHLNRKILKEKNRNIASLEYEVFENVKLIDTIGVCDVEDMAISKLDEEISAKVFKELGSFLSPKILKMLKLRYKGHSHAEIADLLGAKERSCTSLCSHAYKRVRKFRPDLRKEILGIV